MGIHPKELTVGTLRVICTPRFTAGVFTIVEW
jgi:hypothetical protein